MSPTTAAMATATRDNCSKPSWLNIKVEKSTRSLLLLRKAASTQHYSQRRLTPPPPVLKPKFQKPRYAKQAHPKSCQSIRSVRVTLRDPPTTCQTKLCNPTSRACRQCRCEPALTLELKILNTCGNARCEGSVHLSRKFDSRSLPSNCLTLCQLPVAVGVVRDVV